MTRMSRMKMRLLLVFLLSPLFGRGAQANTITAASCLQANVQTAIASAAAGDIVVVPAGTCSWSGGLSISGIQLIGAGSSTSGTVITAGAVTMTKHATLLTRMSGFRFTDTSIHLTVNGGTYPFRVDNNYFNMQGGNFQILFDANGGVVDHNTFDGGSTSSIIDVIGIHPGGNEWSLSTSFGNADSTGQQNIYFEDNTFLHLSVALDGDQGARVVIRHNQMQSSAVVFHGTTPNDTSGNPPGGARQLEVYNNTFSVIDAVNDNIPQGWVWVRGETGVIANNTMANNNTQQFGGKPNILLTVGCNQAGFTTYPVPFQLGQSAVTSSEPENPPTHPMLIFGNTGAGTSISIAGQGGTGGTYDCSTPGNFIQINRDYYTINHWNWTPFTYPHPLNLGPSSGNGPVPPQGLTASVH